jgi:lipoate-protein ligase A
LDGAWGKLSVPDSFFRLSQALVAGLQRLGVVATIADGGSEGDTPPRTGACFHVRRMPAILVSGKKLIGSAQRRWGNSLLQHGSLLLEFDVTMQQTVFPAWCDPSGDVTWLASILGGMPHRSTVEAALVAGWAEVTGASWALGGPTCEERSEAEALARGRYGNSGWTFQR